MRRVTHVPGPRTRLRWNRAEILANVVVIMATLVLVLWAGAIALHLSAHESPSAPHSVPLCTDAIADAGGICIGEPGSSQVGTLDLPPCPTEDSDHCYWDAATMGNGRGQDVVTP